MTPKEKAKELFDKYFDMKWQSYNKKTTSIKSMTKSSAKQCALIAVEEILNHHSQEQGLYRIDTYYWQQVKRAIDNL